MVTPSPTGHFSTHGDEELVESMRRVKLRERPDGGEEVGSVSAGARMRVLERGRNPKTGQPRLRVAAETEDTGQLVHGWASVHSRDGRQLLRQVFEPSQSPSEGLPHLSRINIDGEPVTMTPRLQASCGPSMVAMSLDGLFDGPQKSGWLVKVRAAAALIPLSVPEGCF